MLSHEEYVRFVEKLHALKPELTPTSYELPNHEYKIPTGRLLDQVLGMRGHREGDVGCYEKQALCLVNYGSATGQEIASFSQRLQDECTKKLGIKIDPEVNVVV